MKISLRPHHLLCLQGYRGFNYSKTSAKYWEKVVENLKTSSDCEILIVEGNDMLCQKCPAFTPSDKIWCVEKSVKSLDEKVKNILGINIGKTYKYKTILEVLKACMTKEKHEEICSGCAWWEKGLCRDTFSKTK